MIYSKKILEIISRASILPRDASFNDRASRIKFNTSGFMEIMIRIMLPTDKKIKVDLFHLWPLNEKKVASKPIIPISSPIIRKLDITLPSIIRGFG